MTHYEERLEHDLAEIRKAVGKVAARVEKAVADAVHSMMTGDRQLASRVILGDLPINRAIRRLDHSCHVFVARHLPSAGHLRFVSSVLRLNIALERIGDYAVTIARETVQISRLPRDPVLKDIDLIADQARSILAQAIAAFNEGNADLARGTKGMGAQVERTYQAVFADFVREGEKERRPVKDMFAVLVVINRLGRVSDQAKNICEETVFAATGETKEPKTYRVLFVDERNDALSLLAEAYARKAFPQSGVYGSAGWDPAVEIDTQVRLFLEKKGLSLRGLEPTPLTSLGDQLAEFHVVVSLEGDARERLPEVPFHTALVQWDVGRWSPGLDAERAAATLEEARKRIAHEMRELMETLRGEGAE